VHNKDETIRLSREKENVREKENKVKKRGSPNVKDLVSEGAGTPGGTAYLMR